MPADKHGTLRGHVSRGPLCARLGRAEWGRFDVALCCLCLSGPAGALRSSASFGDVGTFRGLPVSRWNSDQPGLAAARALAGRGDGMSMPVYLRRGEIDKLSGLIYGGLNSASPVWTWPEERGADAGTQVTSGDLQEAWFPVNFCRLFRDCFLYEEDATLHLAAGIPRFWYDLGKPIGVTDAPTHFGPVSYQMQYDPSQLQITGEATFA